MKDKIPLSSKPDGYYWYRERDKLIIVKKEGDTLWTFGRTAVLGGELLDPIPQLSQLVTPKD